MKRNQRERIDRRLDALRARIPDVACRGLCYHTCTTVDASARERDRITALGHGDIQPVSELPAGTDTVPSCPLLSADHRCTVYEERPIICRLWGAVQGLPCPYGCRPVDGRRLLPDAEAMDIIAESIHVGGAASNAGPDIPADTLAAIRKVLRDDPLFVSAVFAAARQADLHSTDTRGTL